MRRFVNGRQGLNIRYLRLGVLAILTLTGACSSSSETNPYVWEASNTGQYADRSAADVTGLQSVGETAEGRGGNKENLIVSGTGQFFQEAESLPEVQQSDEGGVELNFVNADLRIIAEAVLGDVLGYAYHIHPNVQANLTLQTTERIDKSALLSILESALRLRNLALIEVENIYRIVPINDAPRQYAAASLALPSDVNRPGFGVQIVPLKYTSPTQMRLLLEPFAPQGGILRVDEARNFLILAGTRQELNAMLQTISTFDVDWLKGMSFGIFPVEYVEAETITKELLNVFGDPQSPIAGLIRLIPIARLNSVLVISPQQRYLEEVKDWITRFDIGGQIPGRKIYVYNVKNGRAVDLASALGQILGAQSNTLGNQGRPAGQNDRSEASDQSQQNTGFSAESGLRIVPNEENNSLLIFASASEFGVVENALKQLDLPPRQVLIEATLIEVTLTDELRYGVQWLFEPGDNTITQSQAANGSIASEFPGFSYVFSGASDARVVLNALESVTDVNVLFAPKLMVLNNQSATLQVGDQVPVPVQTAVGTGDVNAPIVNSIQFRDTGVILSVTPRINEGGLVLIDIEQEVSDVVQTTSSGIDAPTIQQRMITSSVAVQSGDTVALGGLIRENISHGSSGVPFISRVPVLGAVFGSKNNTLRRTELIVLITPRIARNPRETAEVMDYLRNQFQALKPIEVE